MAPAGSHAPTGAGHSPQRGWRFRGDVAIADVAFEAWGATLEELFVAAADATINTMAGDLETIEVREHRAIRIQELSADLLLYRFLEELIYLKDAHGLLLRVPVVRIHDGEAGTLVLDAEALGEPLDARRHHLLTDVKAVTLHRLRVERRERGWEGFVVLDV